MSAGRAGANGGGAAPSRAAFSVRSAQAQDTMAMAELFAAVSQERDGIASEPPVDVGRRAGLFAQSIDWSVVAVAQSAVIGMIHVEATAHGFGDLGMLVDRAWRGRGVGTALLQAAVDMSRSRGLHKLSLEVFPHNAAGLALYRRAGFIEEGRRVRQYRRASGELWDAVMMGLLL